MISIQPYHDSMFGDVYDAFLADDDLQLAREEWSRLFRCQDTTDEQHGGYVLLDDTRIVGISGMRFSSRVIEGNHHKLCALHSWMVAPEYRGHSLMMLRPLMRLKDCSLVDFSPTAPVRRILRRLRFQDLDSALRVMLPVPGRRRPDLESSVESDQAGNSLLGADRSLFDAHRAPHIRHVFCTDQNRGCYVVYTCVTRWRIAYCHVHYISDPEFFAANSVQIRREICRRERVRIVACNDRQFAHLRVPASFRCPMTNGQMYRSHDLKPRHFDTLHSDIALLNLTTMKSMSSVMNELRDRLTFKRPADPSPRQVVQADSAAVRIRS